MKRFLSLFLVSFLVLANASMAFAGQFEAEESYVLAEAGIVNDDLYVAGGGIDIAGSVFGDLIAAGGMVDMNGLVSGDLLIAGGDVAVYGDVQDDLRAAAGQMELSGNVAGDVVVATGMLKMSASSSVVGDVRVAAGTVIMNGVVNGEFKMVGGELLVGGTFNGDVNVTAEKITLGEGAVLNGNFTYKSPNEVEMADGSVVRGEVVFDQVEKYDFDKYLLKGVLIAKAMKFLIVLVTAMILVLLFEKGVRSLVEHASSNFWPSCGKGLIFLVVVPVAVVLLLVTVLGAFLGGLLGISYVLFLMMAKVLTGILLGALLVKHFKKAKKVSVNWKVVLLGVFLAEVLCLIPVVGWLILFVLMLTSLGSIVSAIKKAKKIDWV